MAGRSVHTVPGAGAGSELVVTLPLLAAARAVDVDGVAPVSEYGRVSGHILIVDDNREAADSLAALLRAIGAETSVAYDGEEAVAIAASVRPAVCILDIGSAGHGRTPARPPPAQYEAGLDFGRADRPDRLGATSEDRLRITEADFDHHLLKPVAIDKLRALLQGREQAA